MSSSPPASKDAMRSPPQGSSLFNSTLSTPSLSDPTLPNSAVSRSQDMLVAVEKDSTPYASQDLATITSQGLSTAASNGSNTIGPQHTNPSQDIQQHMSEGDPVLEQPSVENALLQVQALMVEKQEYQRELDDKDAKIKKQEALVLTLNREIIDQDNAIFDLQRRNREKDAALMAKDGIIAELDTKVKKNKQLRVEVKERDRSIAALNYTLYANLLEGEKLERENTSLRKKIKKIKERPGRSLRNLVTGLLQNPKASQAPASTSQALAHSPTGHPPDQGRPSTSHPDSPFAPPRTTNYPYSSTPFGQMRPQRPARATQDDCSITRVERGRSHHPRLEVEPRLRDSGIRGWLGGVGRPAERMFRCSYEDLLEASRAGE